MRKRRHLSAVLALLTSAATASVFAVAAPASAAGGATPDVKHQQSGDSGPAVYQDVSKPLRDVPPQAGSKSKRPVEDVAPMPQSHASTANDPVVQTSAAALMPT